MSEAGTANSRQDQRVLAGRYQLLRFIDSGGMAEVWEGYDTLLARPVAIKMPLPHLARQEEAMRRFRREAVAAARLGHPNVVAVYDTGTDGEDSFIVMERVEGVSLRQLIREGPLPVGQAVSIAAQVAGALEFAHRAGLVHRDVKPGNILVTADAVVKVADFGIAKAMLDEDLTATGSTMGTASYLAPEQIEGVGADGRADVYALGVVLYEMLCGQPPFSADSEVAVAMKHLTEAPSLPSTSRPGVPPWLDGVVLRALAKNPTDRFESAAAMATVLRQGGSGDGPPDRGAYTPTGTARLGPVPFSGNGSGRTGTGELVWPEPPSSDERSRTARWPAEGGTTTRDVTARDPAGARTTANDVTARDPGAPTTSHDVMAPGSTSPDVAIPDPTSGDVTGPGRDPAPPAVGLTRRTHDGSVPGRARTRPRRRILPWVVAGVVVAGVVVAAVVLARLESPGSSHARHSPPGTSAAPPSTTRAVIPISHGVSFDPPADGGDGVEDAAGVPNLFDGNPATYWQTDQYYGSRKFGNLKPGVGFVLELDHPTSIGTLTLLTSTPGWQASIYLSGQTHPTIGGWGQPTARTTATGQTVTVSLGGHRATDVLVWFTLLSPNNQIRIGEATLRSP